MKRFNSIMWGAVFIVGGVLFALNVLELTSINFFFEGWWTFLIIIPSFIGLFTTKEKILNGIALFAAAAAFLCIREIITFVMLLKLIAPVLIILIGIKLIYMGVADTRRA